MNTTVCNLTIHTRWWFAPVVRLCLLASRLTGWKPSEASIKWIVRYGVTFDI